LTEIPKVPLAEERSPHKRLDLTGGEARLRPHPSLCDALLQINPPPIVALNRAVAVVTAQGAAAELDALDAAATLAGDSALAAGYHLFPAFAETC
jgi:hypothetical protein